MVQRVRVAVAGWHAALVAWSVNRPRCWTAVVREGRAGDELEPLRTPVDRLRPPCQEAWVWSTAWRPALAFTARTPSRTGTRSQNQ
jgi:hypothetical protein